MHGEGGGWQGAFKDSWWKPGVLWLLEGADSGDICASCCSAIVETLKVNYNINDSALQAVVPYYASIIPCMGTQRHRGGIGRLSPPPPPPHRPPPPHNSHLTESRSSCWKDWSVYRGTPSTAPPCHHMARCWLDDWFSFSLFPSLTSSFKRATFHPWPPPLPTSLAPPPPPPPHVAAAAIPDNICLILPPSTAEWNQSGRDVMCEQKWLATRKTCIWEHGARALCLRRLDARMYVRARRHGGGEASARLIGITQTSPSCHPSPDFQ